MIKRLSDLKIGEYATIMLVHGRGRMRTRMFDMGITPGAEIFYRKNAPMGDPIQISIRGYELTLRKCEAFHVLIDTVVKGEPDISDAEKQKQIKLFIDDNNIEQCEKCNKNHKGIHFRQNRRGRGRTL